MFRLFVPATLRLPTPHTGIDHNKFPIDGLRVRGEIGRQRVHAILVDEHMAHRLGRGQFPGSTGGQDRSHGDGEAPQYPDA